MAVPRQHRDHAPSSVACGVITSSDSRTPDTDDSGKLLKDLLLHAGHTVSYYAVVRDDPAEIRNAVDEAVKTCDAILTNGGTGLGRRDVTVATLAPLFERAIPGFGEIFRRLSYDTVGSAAWLSGAVAGIYRGRLVFCLPGSPDACRLAMERLILPELPHAVGVMRR